MAGHEVCSTELFGLDGFFNGVDGYAQGRHVVEQGRMGFQIRQRALETGNVETDGSLAEMLEDTCFLVDAAEAQRPFGIICVLFFGKVLFTKDDEIYVGSGDLFELIPVVRRG